MQGIIHFETFLITGILLNITPGNDTIFILTRSIAQGRMAGIMSVLGIATGTIVHTLLEAFGLSMLLAKSAIAFNIVKYAGAAYVLYIGFKMLTDKKSILTNNGETKKSVDYLKTYRDGMITNVLNPKVALFFIAFLPQFIEPTEQHAFLPFLILGITFNITGTIWCLILANFAGFIFDKLKHNANISMYINRVCGVALIALGIKVATTSR